MAEKDKGGAPEIKSVEIDAENPTDLDVILTDAGGAEIVTAGKEGGSDDDEGEGQRRRGKRNVGRDMSRLRADKRQAEAAANEAMTMNERLLAENKRLKEEKDRADAAALENYGARIEADLKVAKEKLTKAKEEGKVAEETELTAEVGRLAGEKQRVENFNARRKEAEKDKGDDDEGGDDKGGKTTQRKDTRTPEEIRAALAEENPDLVEFMDSNPWFEPGKPEFDRDMHLEAVNYGRYLEAKYQREGKEIDASYWKQIKKHVMQEFPDKGDGEDGEDEKGKDGKRRTAPAMDRDDDAIPARGTNGNGGDGRQSTRRVIRLDANQQDMVRSYIDNGIYKHDDGKPYTFQEGAVRMARSLEEDARRQKERGR